MPAANQVHRLDGIFSLPGILTLFLLARGPRGTVSISPSPKASDAGHPACRTDPPGAASRAAGRAGGAGPRGGWEGADTADRPRTTVFRAAPRAAPRVPVWRSLTARRSGVSRNAGVTSDLCAVMAALLAGF